MTRPFPAFGSVMWAGRCSVGGTTISDGYSTNRIEWDNQKPWADTKHTRLDELDPLCAFHNDLARSTTT
jgi:hypothetical protein